MNISKSLSVTCFITAVFVATAIQANDVRNETLAPSNASLARKLKPKAVLVVNQHGTLRNGPEDDSVKSLLYLDYDDNGKKLNEFWMYNLQNVATFFEVFLDTKICYGKCDN